MDWVELEQGICFQCLYGEDNLTNEKQFTHSRGHYLRRPRRRVVSKRQKKLNNG